MKTITLAELKTLLARTDWNHKQSLRTIERTHRTVEKWNDENDYPDLIDISHIEGKATKKSTLKVDGISDISITYTENFNFDEFQKDTLLTGIKSKKPWRSSNIIILDEDGLSIKDHEMGELLPSKFSDIDYSKLKIEKITDIDIDEDSKMETFTLDIDNEPNIRFQGEKISSVSSSDDRAYKGRYSGEMGRCTELSLYKTASGKYICHKIKRTRLQGERVKFKGAVCKSIEEVKDFFGHRWLAKELYDNAKIDDAVDVD